MNSEDILALGTDTEQGTIDGVRVLFRAYLDATGADRLIWRIGTSTGNEAVFDGSRAVVILPPGRSIMLNGQRLDRLAIPRWMADALVDDFDTLHTEHPHLTSVDDTSIQTADDQVSETEPVKPMFDSESGTDEEDA